MRPGHEDPDLHTLLAADPPAQAAWLAARGLPVVTLLPLVNACAQRCFFCAGPGTSDLPAAAATPRARIAAHLAARPAGVERLLLGGNEPTLHPAFEEIVASAKVYGYTRVELMTNGATLLGRAAGWARAGVAEVVVPLYATDAELHDTVTGVRCHAQVLAGLGEAVAAGMSVRVHTLLLRRTLGELPRLAAWVRTWTGHRLAVGLLRPKPGFDWAGEAPTLGEIRRTLAAIPASERPVLVGAPACLAWGEGDGVAPGAPTIDAEEPALLARLYFASQARRYPVGCDACAARSGCPGLVDAYARGADPAVRVQP